MMRVLSAAMRLYLATHLRDEADVVCGPCDEEGGDGDPDAAHTPASALAAAPTPASAASPSVAPPSSAPTSAGPGFCTALRERLSLSLIRGPRGPSAPSSSPADLEAHFEWIMRSAPVALDVLHALCRSDLNHQAALLSTRSTRSMPVRRASRASQNDLLSVLGDDSPPRPSTPSSAGGHSSSQLPSLPASISASSLSPSLSTSLSGAQIDILAATDEEPAAPMSELMEAMLLPLRMAPSGASTPRMDAPRTSRSAMLAHGPRPSLTSIDTLGSEPTLPAVDEAGGADERRNSVSQSTPDARLVGARANRSVLDESLIQDHF